MRSQGTDSAVTDTGTNPQIPKAWGLVEPRTQAVVGAAGAGLRYLSTRVPCGCCALSVLTFSLSFSPGGCSPTCSWCAPVQMAIRNDSLDSKESIHSEVSELPDPNVPAVAKEEASEPQKPPQK